MMNIPVNNNLIFPAWNAPKHIKALITTRKSPNLLQITPVSSGQYAQFNLATHVGDNLEAVLNNRNILNQLLPSKPFWLKQTHSNKVIELLPETDKDELLTQSYDGSCTNKQGIVCGILTADCIPILVSDLSGNFVAAIHAGWRGVYNQIINKFLSRIPFPKDQIISYIGPAISKEYFIVGQDVLELLTETNKDHITYFTPHPEFVGKFYCDLVGLAITQIKESGILDTNITNSNMCTYANPDLFYSYRRNNITGRIASLIWIE